MGACMSKFKSLKDDRSAGLGAAPEIQPSLTREEKPDDVASTAVAKEKNLGGGGGGKEAQHREVEELGTAGWLHDDTRRRSLGHLLQENDEPKNPLVVESKVSDKEPDVQKPSKEAEVTTPEPKEIDVKALEVKISEKIIKTEHVISEKTLLDVENKKLISETPDKSTQEDQPDTETPSVEAEIKTKEIEIQKKSGQEEKPTIVASSMETSVKQAEVLVEKSTQMEEVSILSKDVSNDSKTNVGGSEGPDESTREDQQPNMEKPSGEAEIKTKEIEILEKSVQEEKSTVMTSSTETNVKQVQVLTVEKSDQIEEISMSSKDSKTIVGPEAPETSVEQVRPQEEEQTSVKDVESETTLVRKKDFEQDVKIAKEPSKLESDVKEEAAVPEPVKDTKEDANTDARQQG